MPVEILFADGFETYGSGSSARALLLDGQYSSAGWGGGDGAQTVSDGTERTGSYYLAVDPSLNNPLRKVLPDPRARVGIACAYRTNAFSTDEQGIDFRDAAGDRILTCAIQSDGSITFYNGGINDTVIGNSEANLVLGAWNHLEIIMLSDAAIGSFELRLNGESIASANSLGLSGELVTSIALGSTSTNANQDFQVDDLVITDGTDFLGPARVLTYFPGGSGSPNEWTPTGAATAHEAVDEATPDDDTSYIEAATVGDEQVFTIPTLSTEIDTVLGIYIDTRSKEDVAGSAVYRIDLTSSGNTEQGDDLAYMTDSYVYHGQYFTEDPNTSGGLFTRTTLEAATFKLVRTV